MAGAHARIQSHEELCNLRHSEINRKLDVLTAGATWQMRFLAAILAALVGWMGVQLYDSKADRTVTTTVTATRTGQ